MSPSRPVIQDRTARRLPAVVDGEDWAHHLAIARNKFNGMARKTEVYVRGYRGQAVYITQRIVEVIDQNLARSKCHPS